MQRKSKIILVSIFFLIVSVVTVRIFQYINAKNTANKIEMILTDAYKEWSKANAGWIKLYGIDIYALKADVGLHFMNDTFSKSSKKYNWDINQLISEYTHLKARNYDIAGEVLEDFIIKWLIYRDICKSYKNNDKSLDLYSLSSFEITENSITQFIEKLKTTP